MADRTELLSILIESALRAGADESVTGVFRSTDYYEEGSSVQKLLPVLIVGVSDAEELVHDGTLYSAPVQITLAVHWQADVRARLAAIRESVRGVMHTLPGLAIDGLTVDGVLETSERAPTFPETAGDVTVAQALLFRVFLSAPVVMDAVLDPLVYLIDRRDHVTYLARSASDPRRIERIRDLGSSTVIDYSYGSWAARDTLEYHIPLPPLSTSPERNLHQPPE